MNTANNPIVEQIVATITATGSALAENTQVTATVTEAKFSMESFVPPQHLETLGFLSSFEIFGNTPLQYIFALITIVLSFLILPLIWRLFVRYIGFAFEKTMPDFSILLKDQLRKFNFKIFFIIAFYFGLLTLALPSYITLTVKGLVFALIAIQIAIIVGPLLEPLIKTIPTLKKPELKPITNRLIALSKIFLWAIVGIFSLSSLGMDTAPILGSIGVLGIGGALAFQQMIPGFIKVLGFHFSKNFSIGDKIIAGTHQGIVEEIDITTTRLKKANGDLIEVKNEDLMTAVVVPPDGPHIISDTIKINLSLDNQLPAFSEIETIFKNSLASYAEANFDKVLFTEFKGTGVNADLNYSIMIDHKIEARHAIISKLITELKSKNISFTA